jgi:hypothetical protein
VIAGGCVGISGRIRRHYLSDKHWEEGEDLRLLEFKTVEYKRKGYAIATDEQLERIKRVPKREFMRRGINQHTLENICAKVPVRATKLAQCLKVLGGTRITKSMTSRLAFVFDSYEQFEFGDTMVRVSRHFKM